MLLESRPEPVRRQPDPARGNRSKPEPAKASQSQPEQARASKSKQDRVQKVCLSFHPNGEEQEHKVFCDSMKRIEPQAGSRRTDPQVGVVNRSKRAIRDYLLG